MAAEAVLSEDRLCIPTFTTAHSPLFSAIQSTVDFRLTLLFLFLYFIRPQDWVQGLIGTNIIRPLILAWIAALLTRRERSPLSGLLATPHDWLLLTYFGYIVWNAPDFNETFNGFLPLVAFYALTVQSLTSWDRVMHYVKFWNWMVLGVAALGVASLYGVDLTGAVDMTAKNFGRLAIGTWLCDNPNALAHTVVVSIPLSYLIYFWKGSAIGRFLIFPACATLAGACAYHTESKGAFLVGGGLVVLIFVIGRPWGVKAFVLATSAVVGISALSFLPRMEKMGSLGTDEGVMGRLMAWEIAHHVMDTKLTGEGWRKFSAEINWEGELIPKSTHSSYVQIGADLGLYGLCLYIGGVWVAGRALISARTYAGSSEIRERCRRCCLILLSAYAVSGWMINREYHTEYFLLIAMAAAVHRLGHAERLGNGHGELESDGFATVGARRFRQRSGDSSDATDEIRESTCSGIHEDVTREESGRFWTRFEVADFIGSAGLTWVALQIWAYVLNNL